MNLLDLPSELLLECASHLSYPDLRHCIHVPNRRLHRLLANSVLLRYHVLQERTAIEENPTALAHLVAAERFDALKHREHRWSSFAPLSRHTILLDFPTAGIYDLTGDYFLVGDVPHPVSQMCTAIRYTATSQADPPEWHRIDVGKSIIDFGMCVEENDLIAVVTCEQARHNLLQMTMNVQLLSFSTGGPHPLAAKPELHLHTVPITHGRPGASIEVVGRTLAISFLYWSEQNRGGDELYLLDWKSGQLLTPPIQIYNSGLVFLTPDILIIPNSADPSLDVVFIPPDGFSTPDNEFHIHCLRLPELQLGHTIYSFQCRGDPNPRSSSHGKSHQRASFLPSPSQGLLLFAFTTGSELAPETTTDHMFVIPRGPFAAALAPLLHLALSHAHPGGPRGLDLPWDMWGPQHTRWLDATPIAKHYITTTCGSRLVAIAHDATVPGKAAPIRVFCFNEAAVDNAPKLELDPKTIPRRPPSFPSLDAFVERVFSYVPYVEIESKETFAFDTVIINNENIIGVRFGGNNVSSLEVLHFG
ncbi:hypothetical protein C8F01DRAFT_1154846 [Mycena amicta]|nr:hypothetical protein C8F01DRAFT_1154846 [Mycena amicta]